MEENCGSIFFLSADDPMVFTSEQVMSTRYELKSV